MPHTMSMKVHSAKAATHAVNFQVLPSTGVWSSWGCRVEIRRRDHCFMLVMFYLYVHLLHVIQEWLKNKKTGQISTSLFFPTFVYVVALV